MRYGPEHKSETHRRIVKKAARRVRAGGLAGAGVAEVMRDSGLTHGGFYKHFHGKADLLGQAIGEAFREMAGKLRTAAEQAPQGEGWKAIVRVYLSAAHCGRPETGCLLAALAPEIARSRPPLKRSLRGFLREYQNQMLPLMPGGSPAERQRAFVVIFSAMLGALEIARLMPDAAGRERILRTVRDFLLDRF